MNHVKSSIASNLKGARAILPTQANWLKGAIKMKCDGCGRIFFSGNRPDGTPNGVTFLTKNGAEITVCADCITKFGMMDAADRKAFMDELERKAGIERMN